MLPDRVSNPGPLTYKSGALPIAQHGPAKSSKCLSTERQIRGSIDDNSKIIFLISQQKHML